MYAMAKSQIAPSAADAYELALRDVKELTLRLRAQIDEHDAELRARLAETGRELHWAHVGDLTHLREGLTELLSFWG